MRAHLVAPLVALAFLTVLPGARAAAPAAFPRSVAYFPLVGALVGAAVAAFDALSLRIVPVGVASALDLVVLALLTGALHLDGVADSADGLMHRGTREERLAAMRQGAIGAYGAVAIALILLAEYAALSELRGAGRVSVLIGAAVLGRWTMSLAVWAFPYVGRPGLGTSFKDGLTAGDVLVASAIAAVVTAIAFGARAGILLALTGALTLILGRFFATRLGGLTGDTYGGLGELGFAFGLVAAVASGG